MSGWRSWARSVGATKNAWPPSIHQTTPVEPGSAAKSRVTAQKAVSPAQRESFPTSPPPGQEMHHVMLSCCVQKEKLSKMAKYYLDHLCGCLTAKLKQNVVRGADRCYVCTFSLVNGCLWARGTTV